LGWVFTASALAGVLGAVACQSSDDGAGSEPSSRAADEGEDESADEPENAARVPDRNTEANVEDEDVAAPDDAQEPAREQISEDAPSEAAAETPSGDTQPPVAAAQTFSACYSNGGAYSECELIYVTVTQAEPARCIQLTIDSCGTYGRQGLSADAPVSWRLAGGSISGDSDPCEFGVFYSTSTSVADATGSVSWDETTPRPSELVFDLTLEPSGGVSGDAEPILLATPEALDVAECEE
jgi:hypothetical protein